jgi:hypothetical protein
MMHVKNYKRNVYKGVKKVIVWIPVIGTLSAIAMEKNYLHILNMGRIEFKIWATSQLIGCIIGIVSLFI